MGYDIVLDTITTYNIRITGRKSTSESLKEANMTGETVLVRGIRLDLRRLTYTNWLGDEAFFALMRAQSSRSAGFQDLGCRVESAPGFPQSVKNVYVDVIALLQTLASCFRRKVAFDLSEPGGKVVDTSELGVVISQSRDKVSFCVIGPGERVTWAYYPKRRSGRLIRYDLIRVTTYSEDVMFFLRESATSTTD